MGIRTMPYAAGVLGVLLAVGLLAQPSYAATGAASLQRQVQPAAGNCEGQVPHQESRNGVTLQFWTLDDGSRICVGTIKVTGSPASSVSAYVENSNGIFCLQIASGTSLTDTCQDVFVAPLSVVGTRRDGATIHSFAINLPQP
jgi:hypothetical protein